MSEPPAGRCDGLPLADVVVADFSTAIPGPLATRILAQLGATVWKVEAPGGDVMRQAPQFGYLNAGKASVVLDLKAPGGPEDARALAAAADVVVEGFRPGVMERFGLGAAQLHEANPAVVYCSISGFGQEGPDRDRPAHDLAYLALAGVIDRHRDSDGRLVRSSLPFPAADVASGLLATTSIMAALRQRERTGSGTRLDLSLADAALLLGSFEYGAHLEGLISPSAPPDSEIPTYGVFETRDGRSLALTIAPHEDHFWRRFCEAVGFDRWIGSDGAQRGAARAELEGDLQALFAARTLAEWEEVLGAVDVPWAPVRTLDEVASEAGGQSGDVPGTPGAPVPLGVAGRSLVEAVPTLGEATERVLRLVGRRQGGA